MSWICSRGRLLAGRGNCHDNAVAESFFQLLKRERIKRKIYVTREHAKCDVFNYIEMFYNTRGQHGHNNGLSPVEFEKQFSKRDFLRVYRSRGDSIREALASKIRVDNETQDCREEAPHRHQRGLMNRVRSEKCP